MRQFTTLSLLLFATLSACEMQMQAEDHKMGFFDRFEATKLGTTKTLVANAEGLRGDWQKMIDVSSEDDRAIPITITLRTEYQTDQTNGTPSLGQPLVGMLQWGVGGAESQVEFDIPPAKYPGDLEPNEFPPSVPMNNIGGGVSITVSASHISLYARNDGAIAPVINTVHRAALVPPLPPNDVVGLALPAKLLAFISPGVAKNSPLERMIFVVGGNTFPALLASHLAPGEMVRISVPPFAIAVRFQRGNPNIEPLNVAAFSTNTLMHRTFNVGVGNEDWFPIDANTTALEITNTAAVAIGRLQAVFSVQPL